MKLKELPPPKWPVTHSERIHELEDHLPDPSLYLSQENILGAIRYHQSFDPNEWCSREPVYFQNGKQNEAKEWCGLTWMEVSHFSFVILYFSQAQLYYIGSPMHDGHCYLSSFSRNIVHLIMKDMEKVSSMQSLNNKSKIYY